jgi:hypothetical protein
MDAWTVEATAADLMCADLTLSGEVAGDGGTGSFDRATAPARGSESTSGGEDLTLAAVAAVTSN